MITRPADLEIHVPLVPINTAIQQNKTIVFHFIQHNNSSKNKNGSAESEQRSRSCSAIPSPRPHQPSPPIRQAISLKGGKSHRRHHPLHRQLHRRPKHHRRTHLRRLRPSRLRGGQQRRSTLPLLFQNQRFQDPVSAHTQAPPNSLPRHMHCVWLLLPVGSGRGQGARRLWGGVFHELCGGVQHFLSHTPWLHWASCWRRRPSSACSWASSLGFPWSPQFLEVPAELPRLHGHEVEPVL